MDAILNNRRLLNLAGFLVCGGMMLFLTVIDIAYFAQHGLFAKEKGGRENWGIIIPMVIMSFLMILRFL